MVEPEIARRCSSCGASVRHHAAFCPQCGQLLGQKQPDSLLDSQTNAVEGLETQIITAPSEGPETQIITAPSEAPETQIIAAPSEGPDTQIITAPSEGPETQIIAVPSEGPDTHEEFHSNPPPKGLETQPLIRQTIQREPTVSEADAIAPPAPDGSRPGIEQNLMGRVDRIRKVSSVVIDQAAYDPSLRFLLVAGVLFILFVILAVISKVIG